MSSERAPTLAEVIRLHILGWADETHTALPVVVTEYDAALQKVSVKPLVKHAFLDEEQQRQLESLGVISNVPVKFLSAGGFVFSVPISDGSTVIDGTVETKATTGAMIFSEASLDRWLSGTGAEVDPEIDHRFDLSDGFFCPGVNPFGDPLPNIPTDHAFAGNTANGIGVHFRRAVVYLGDGDIATSKKVALDGDNVSGGSWTVASGSGALTLTYVSPDFVPGAAPVGKGVTIIIALAGIVPTITGFIAGVPFAIATTASATWTIGAGIVASATQAKGK